MSNKGRMGLTDTGDSEEFSAEREQELSALKEAYRIANLDRVRYSEEMQLTLKKLNDEVEQMEKENDDLNNQLRVADSKPNQLKDDKTCEDLANLAENKDWLDRQIENEKILHSELDSKIRERERKLRMFQLHVGGSNFLEKSNKLKRAQNQLEGRLQNTLKTYCECLALNSNLRREIDELRLERSRYDEIFKKLDCELAKLRQECDQYVECSTLLFEQREDARCKMVQIMEKAEKDTLQHNSEMKELVRVIDHDRKLKEFMTYKSKERPEDPQLIAYKERLAREADTQRAANSSCLENMEASFIRMKELLNQPDINKLVDTFIENEDRNFALFNYINVQHLEVEHLQGQVQSLREGISSYVEMKATADSHREEQMQVLDNQRSAVAQLADSSDSRLTTVLKIMEQLTAAVTSIFRKIHCNSKELERTLGYSEGVTDANVQVYLGLVEQRTNELLLVYNYIGSHRSDTAFVPRPVLMGTSLKKPLTGLELATPTLNDDFDGSGGPHLIPLTREEIMGLVTPRINDMETAQEKTVQAQLEKEQKVVF